MTHPPITLSRWHPLDLGVHRLTGPTTRTFDAEPPGATLLVDLDPRMAADRNLVTLHRAAQVNGLTDSLFEPNHKLEGHPWYDRLPCVIAMDTEASIDGEKMAFTWTDDQSSNVSDLQESVALLHGGDNDTIGDWETFESGRNAVAEHIVVRMLVRSRAGTEVRRLRTDFGVGTEYQDWPENAGIIVTPDCTLSIDALEEPDCRGDLQAQPLREGRLARNPVAQVHGRGPHGRREAAAERARRPGRGHPPRGPQPPAAPAARRPQRPAAQEARRHRANRSKTSRSSYSATSRRTADGPARRAESDFDGGRASAGLHAEHHRLANPMEQTTAADDMLAAAA